MQAVEHSDNQRQKPVGIDVRIDVSMSWRSRTSSDTRPCLLATLYAACAILLQGASHGEPGALRDVGNQQ